MYSLCIINIIVDFVNKRWYYRCRMFNFCRTNACFCPSGLALVCRTHLYEGIHLGLNSTCLFLMEVWSDRWSTCKFRNARSAFRNLHVDPLSLLKYLHEKQTKKNSILIFILYQNCTVLATKYSGGGGYTKHPVIILRASLFVVTPSHVASWKIECQNFSYVYRSIIH